MPAAVLPIHAQPQPSAPALAARPQSAQGRSCAPGLGGCSVAALVGTHCPDLHAPQGVIVEYLDAQAGTWQYSLDGAASWRGIRTDLVNRPGHLGLALDGAARLRVLPFADGGRKGVRVVLHAAQRALDGCSGSYCLYAPEDRDAGAHSITLVLGLAAINGKPPAAAVPRPRNKRALAAQRLAQQALAAA